MLFRRLFRLLRRRKPSLDAALILAVASSLTYSGYMTGMEHTELKEMNPTKVSCYMGLSNALIILLLNLPLRQINFFLPPKAMVYTLYPKTR